MDITPNGPSSKPPSTGPALKVADKVTNQQTAPMVAVTVITNRNGPATKTFSLGSDGRLIKKSAAQIADGEARRVVVAGVPGLLRLIKGLRSNEALVYGLADIDHARIVTQKRKALNGDGAICRDEKHFHFAEGGPGVMMIDYDPMPGHSPRGPATLDQILCEVLPEWGQTERAWRPSSSAFIYRSDGTELIGSGGWRGYTIVKDASAIPALGAELYRRLWAAGHGYLRASESGALLDRSLIDASVWQASRLDFVAAPVMGPGLKRRPPAERIFSGEA